MHGILFFPLCIYISSLYKVVVDLTIELCYGYFSSSLSVNRFWAVLTKFLYACLHLSPNFVPNLGLKRAEANRTKTKKAKTKTKGEG